MPKRSHTPWTENALTKLRAWYPDRRTAWIAEQLGHSTTSVYQAAHRLGLRKSGTYLSSETSGRLQREDHRGRTTRFEKGLVPWNKGKRYQAGGRSKDTQFQPGARAGRSEALYQPIGAERISKDGYLERKVNDDLPMQRRWRAVHLLNWEALHGPLPKGHALVFRDGDKRNVDPSNLELITRADLMRRNSVHNLPPALKEVVDLKRIIARRIGTIDRKAATE